MYTTVPMSCQLYLAYLNHLICHVTFSLDQKTKNMNFILFSSWFRVRNNLLEPISRSNRIVLAGGILIIESVQVRGTCCISFIIKLCYCTIVITVSGVKKMELGQKKETGNFSRVFCEWGAFAMTKVL